jgi:hypothetical protein
LRKAEGDFFFGHAYIFALRVRIIGSVSIRPIKRNLTLKFKLIFNCAIAIHLIVAGIKVRI